jgi:hypothetical protein
MSGGYFNYDQFKIEEIADKILRVLNGTQGEDEFEGLVHDPAVRARLQHAVHALKIASVYAHRADWFLSGDDGEESFCRRLDEELDALEGEMSYDIRWSENLRSRRVEARRTQGE